MTFKRLNWQNEHETCPCRQNFTNSAIVYLTRLRLRQLAEINQIIDSSDPLRLDFTLADVMRSKSRRILAYRKAARSRR